MCQRIVLLGITRLAVFSFSGIQCFLFLARKATMTKEQTRFYDYGYLFYHLILIRSRFFIAMYLTIITRARMDSEAMRVRVIIVLVQSN